MLREGKTNEIGIQKREVDEEGVESFLSASSFHDRERTRYESAWRYRKISSVYQIVSAS